MYAYLSVYLSNNTTLKNKSERSILVMLQSPRSPLLETNNGLLFKSSVPLCAQAYLNNLLFKRAGMIKNEPSRVVKSLKDLTLNHTSKPRKSYNLKKNN